MGRLAAQVVAQGGGDAGQAGLVGAHRAGQGVARDVADEGALADDDPGLRAAEELVAAEEGHRRAVAQALGHHRLVRQAELGGVEERTGAEVVDQW